MILSEKRVPRIWQSRGQEGRAPRWPLLLGTGTRWQAQGVWGKLTAEAAAGSVGGRGFSPPMIWPRAGREDCPRVPACLGETKLSQVPFLLLWVRQAHMVLGSSWLQITGHF